ERGQDDHFDRVEPGVAGDPAGGLQPVELGHADVHQHHVGPQLAGERHGPGAVARLAHHLQVVLVAEDRPEPGPYQGLVVGQQHADHVAPFSGSEARTRKPPSGRGPASRLPPSAAARSRMPRSPKPLPSVYVTPGPSSSTRIMISPSPAVTASLASPAPEWRATFVSASRMIRVAARSTSTGSRSSGPDSSVWTFSPDACTSASSRDRLSAGAVGASSSTWRSTPSVVRSSRSVSLLVSLIVRSARSASSG